MSYARIHDIGAFIKGQLAGANSAQTGGAEAEVDGIGIDRLSFGDRFQSCKLVIGIRAKLESGETFAMAINAQDSPTSAVWTDYDDGSADSLLASTIVIAASAAGDRTDVVGLAELDVRLQRADRWIRFQYTPAFSLAGTDTCELAACVVLAGADELPAT